MAVLIIPEVLHRFSEVMELNIPIQTLNEFSAWLEQNQPRLHQVIFQQSQSNRNKMSGFLNLYLEDRAVTHQLTDAIPLSPSSSLRLITSVSGG